MTTLATLRSEVNNKLGNYAYGQIARATGDGTTTVFNLPDSHISTLVVTVDSVAKTETTHYTVDYTVGVVTFLSAPAATSENNIVFSYLASEFTTTQVDYAINQAIYRVWADVAAPKMDTASIVLAADTYEYSLPVGCAYVKRVDYRADDTQPYKQIHGWRVLDDATRKLYIYQPAQSGTLRIHYVPYAVALTSTNHDLTTNAFIPERAHYAIVAWAAAELKRQQLARRTDANQFHNAEKQNVVKPYELQRVLQEMEAEGELELMRARMSPRRGL